MFTLKTLPADPDRSGADVAESSGVSLHAGVAANGGERDKLERLARYIARPPIATERLALTDSGHIRYTLKTPYRDGTSHVILEPMDFMARLALLIQYGNFRYFVGGDIEAHTEAKIAERDLVVNVDVYQANHHASHTSSSASFLLDMIPTLIVVSNGDHGGFRHPRQLTLNNYAALNPAPTVLQLNKYTKGGDGGNVADEFIADLEPAGQGGDILLTVQPDGSYTATYRDISRSFQQNSETCRRCPASPS